MSIIVLYAHMNYAVLNEMSCDYEATTIKIFFRHM